MKPDLILGFEDYQAPAKALCDALSVPFALVEQHLFPDGETKLKLPDSLPTSVAVVRSLDQPNHKLIDLMLLAATARNLGVQHLALVAPYLCYMRQDIAFSAGEAISQRVIGDFLAQRFDSVITVDPHLHRTPRLELAVPARSTTALPAAALIGAFLAAIDGAPLLLGPDSESLQWVSATASVAGLEYVIGEKHRTGDRDVSVTLPDVSLRDRHVVLLDDVASTGETLASGARAAVRGGAARIDAIVTHALFVPGALETLAEAGVRSVWSTDSIAHPSNTVVLTPLLARALSG